MITPPLSPSPGPATALARSRNSRAAPEDPTLRYACREMEGFFLSILLKEGLNSLTEDSEEGRSSAYGPMLEHAIEQVSRDLSAQQGMGLADLLYDQLSR